MVVRGTDGLCVAGTARLGPARRGAAGKAGLGPVDRGGAKRGKAGPGTARRDFQLRGQSWQR